MQQITGTLKMKPLVKEKFARGVLVQEPSSEVRMVSFKPEVREKFNLLSKGDTITVEGRWEEDRYKGGQQFVVYSLPSSHHETKVQDQDGVGGAPPANHNRVTIDTYTRDLEGLLDRLSIDGVWRALPAEALSRYLDIYVSVEGHEFWDDVLRKVHEKVDDFARRVSYAVMMPEQEGMNVQRPATFMFSLNRFSSYDEQDWVAVFAKRIESDKRMVATRLKLAELGAVPGVGRTPITRQAMKRLHDEVARRGLDLDVTVPNGITLRDSLFRIVSNYGGEVVSRVFDKQGNEVTNLLNFNTPYFFERLIHNQYNREQLIAMKNRELPQVELVGIPNSF